MRPLRTLVLGFAAVLLPTAASAQGRLHPRWEIPGFDFRPNGAWRKLAREVAATRARLLAQRQFWALNAPMAAGVPMPSATAVSGVLREPVILFRYKDTPASVVQDPASYDAVLFASPTPPFGRPYTVRTFYEQMSNNLLSIQGQSYGPAQLDSNEVTYAGAPPCTGNPFGTSNCNGLFNFSPPRSGLDPVARMQSGLTEALQKLDLSVDWTLYDSDNDGFVDLVVFVQPAKDGACGGTTNNHLWAHRFQLATPFVTHSTNLTTMTKERVLDYILQSGVGGASSCDSTSIMPIGTVAHETGHAFGLPDLYDTGNSTEGIGRWGLMGAGNYSSPSSPARMEAWSLNELGWVTLAPLTTSGSYSFGPAPTSDIAFLVRPSGSNPRGEYFLLENRQAVEADTALIRNACQVWYQQTTPPPCFGGLLVWHVDSQQVVNGGLTNDVNNGPIHGLELLQADGRGNLDANPNATGCTPPAAGCSDRGDAGDPYPGVLNNTKFSYRTNPAAVMNSDGSFIGFAVDQITQLSQNGQMSFRLQFGSLTIVRASDTADSVTVDNVSYTVFRDLLDNGSSHSISVVDPQLSSDQRTRYRFVSWSDGQPNPHTITGSLSGGTYIATVARDFKLLFSGVNGTVTPSQSQYTSGSFVPENTAVTLTASTTVSGATFVGWSGDTTTTTNPITLPMARPYTVTATYQTTLAISTTDPRPNGVMGAQYADTLKASGGIGTYTWSLTGGALPAGLSLSSAGVVSGIPTKTGTFQYQVQVSSGTSQLSKTFNMSVTAPTLATSAVVNQLLNGTGTLTTDELRYLNLLGNNNSGFDVGDFLAWVQATGAPLTAAAVSARAARTARRAGGRP